MSLPRKKFSSVKKNAILKYQSFPLVKYTASQYREMIVKKKRKKAVDLDCLLSTK